uniref:Uncharacterized protein n=1 Tax=Pseudo-nitzschia australis TaxID=44445 RepID=A0A7S4AX42_9STRA|mmetsp:Transcript_13750/g.28846  ORF Transcript_13750/g.28846 Transcript_13750/m.28846 type:complete len:191 (+) Transcript_13750:61-633(+)
MSSLQKENKDAGEFASAVLTGTVIGRTLQDALRSLSEEDTEDPATEYATKLDRPRGDGINEEKEDEGDHDTRPYENKKKIVRMDKQSMGRIIRSFQEAVTGSRICHEPDKDSAPRALLKGRCDYYNKYGQNWMVVMDQVRIKARPRKFTKRRRDKRPSLWDRDDDRTATTTKKELVVTEKIQLLAYRDIS